MLLGSLSGLTPDFLSALKIGGDGGAFGGVDKQQVMDPNQKSAGGGGVLDKIGAFLKSDQGKAALLRSGAATLDGGLGAGIKAGAGYIDDQKATAAKSKQQGFENALATGKLDLDKLSQQQKNDLGLMGVDVDLRQLGETSRHNKAGEGIDVRGQNVSMRGQDVTRANSVDGDATSRANNAAQVGASIYGKNLDYMTEGQKLAAGIGSKQPTAFTETQTVQPKQDGYSPGFLARGLGYEPTPATPKTITTTRVPMAAAGVTASPPAEAIAALKSNPNLRPQFEAKYGPGSASQFMGGR